MPEFRCTRNALYDHDCLGHDDLTARQGHYITADNEEQAREQMGIRFPEEIEAGFTVQPWKSFNVKIVPMDPNEWGQPRQEQPQS